MKARFQNLLPSVSISILPSFFFFNDPAPTEIYTLSLHDALPIPQLRDAHQNTDAAWSERIARALAHVLRGDLVIRNARLFDPRDLRVMPATSVVVSGERIVR